VASTSRESKEKYVISPGKQPCRNCLQTINFSYVAYFQSIENINLSVNGMLYAVLLLGYSIHLSPRESNMKTRHDFVYATALLLLSSAANATLITGAGDPDYDTLFQGASAHTFADKGYTVGTGATDLKVDTGTFTDPAGLIFGSVYAVNGSASGTTTNKLTYAYSAYGATAASANARDYQWLQNYGTNTTTDPSLDTPWRGTIWDLGGQANQAVVFPIVDHGPLPSEVVEYTVYLTNDPASTDLTDWHLAILDKIYMQGWEDDSIALADGFTTVWRLLDGSTFRYVSVQGVGSQAIRPLFDTEDEIYAVAGLTAEGGSVGGTIPEPGTLALAGLGLVALGYSRKRRIA
jgi:hypothetical protein